jgi:uncharacterized protein (DUF1697 family)
MARYVAFLRAVNVGGHVVKMDVLRRQFEALGLADVETFIASGNVIFASKAAPAALERRIERRLGDVLGYDVATFIRTDTEVAKIAAYEAFAKTKVATSRSLNVALLTKAIDAQTHRTILALRSDINDFHVNGRELYWLCQVGQGHSKFNNVAFEKVVGQRATFRGLNTMRRLADKLR